MLYGEMFGRTDTNPHKLGVSKDSWLYNKSWFFFFLGYKKIKLIYGLCWNTFSLESKQESKSCKKTLLHTPVMFHNVNSMQNSGKGPSKWPGRTHDQAAACPEVTGAALSHCWNMFGSHVGKAVGLCKSLCNLNQQTWMTPVIRVSAYILWGEGLQVGCTALIPHFKVFFF